MSIPGENPTSNNGEQNPATSSEVTDEWKEVSDLADKMGEQTQEESPAKQRIRSFLENFDPEKGALEEKEQEELIEAFKTGDFWDDKDFVQLIVDKLEVEPHNLCGIGMPVEVVLDNEKYYSEMVEDECSGMSLIELYKAMSKTPENLEKFKKDIAHFSWMYEISDTIEKGLEGECAPEELNMLATLKEAGVCLIDNALNLSSNDRDKERENAQDLANFLFENKLLDGREVEGAYEIALQPNFSLRQKRCLGIIDVAIKNHIKPESDDEDVVYWSNLSEETQENQIASFVFGTDRERDEFDFSKKPVMRLFAREKRFSTSVTLWGVTPKIKEALHSPALQDIIMETMETEQKAGTYREGETPNLFRMLASDRYILEDMKDRDAFANYPECQKIGAISKIVSGNFTERDRILLFAYGEYSHLDSDKNFTENGELSDSFLYDICTSDRSEDYIINSILDKVEKKKADTFRHLKSTVVQGHYSEGECFLYGKEANYLNTSLYFDENGPKPEFWQECFQRMNFQFLEDALEKGKEISGLDEPTQTFLKNYSLFRQSRIWDLAKSKKEFYQEKNRFEDERRIIPEFIDKYFDENGPKPEFWQACIREDNFSFLEKAQSLIPDTEAPTKSFLESYRLISDSVLWQATLFRTGQTQNDKDASLQAKLDFINKYFDENGPKPEFWQESLGAGDIELLNKALKDGKDLSCFDEPTKAFLGNGSVIKSRLWAIHMRHKGGEEISQSEKISNFINKYFDENGPKPEYWQECFKLNDDLLLYNQFKTDMPCFDDATNAFLKNYGIIKDSTLFVASMISANVEQPEESYKLKLKFINEYFDGNGLKPEFWQDCFKANDFNTIDSEIRKAQGSTLEEKLDKMGLGGITKQFFLGRSSEALPLDAINESNIVAALVRFIKEDAIDWNNASDSDLKIKEAFERSEVKDLALDQLRKIYREYINGDENAEMPAELKVLYRYMEKHDGAGPLSQIEAFLGFVGNLEPAGEKGRTYTKTIEEKMAKNHWTNQEKSNFYAISAEVLQASPDLYLEFAELFANIEDKKDFETFVTDIYPLYRANLALLRSYEDHSNGIGAGYTEINYNSVDMEALKNQLHNSLLPFNLKELSPEKRQEGIKMVREKIFAQISDLFREKFGFLPDAIPDNFDESRTKVIEDMALYLGNLNRPSVQKKDLIGFFLAAQLGGKDNWDKLRSGEAIRPGDYLNVASAFNVSRALEEGAANNPVNSENTKIESPERLTEFRKELQKETTSMRLGNVQTVDLKLQNLVGNIQELTDPDLYPEEIDKERVVLLGRYPVKAVGKVASTMYQRMNGKAIEFAEGEEEIASAMTQILEQNGIEVTPDNIKAYFQSGLGGIREPFSIIASIEKEGAIEKIGELQTMLTPPDEVARIFSRIGEEFKPQSGAVAVNADLDYLENLVVKQKEDLNEEEIALLNGYINSIRAKMAELDGIYEKIVQNFEKMKGSIHENTTGGVKEKVREIEKIINDRESQSIIATTCTGNMTTVIENMRACLSCKTKGINNDTNLTFGEGYKFYLYSNNSLNNGSTSDEIIYFVPVGEGESRRMGFVMDRVYGFRNSDVLVSHVETILKKARGLKEQFPETSISIIIPSTTMGSCSTSMTAEELLGKLGSSDGTTATDLESELVTVPESGLGDHYIEFGHGSPRDAGEKIIEGIEIII